VSLESGLTSSEIADVGRDLEPLLHDENSASLSLARPSLGSRRRLF